MSCPCTPVERKAVAVSGSCCQSCADAEYRINARAMALYGGPVRFTARLIPDGSETRVGSNAFDPVQKAQPWDAAIALNANVDKLSTDVVAWAQTQTKASIFNLDWASFIGDWKAWYAQKGSETLVSTIGLVGDNLDAYNVFKDRFAKLLDEASKAGVKTNALVPEDAAPLAKWWDGIPSWVFPVGLAVVAIVILYPVAMASIAARKAAWAAGLAV